LSSLYLDIFLDLSKVFLDYIDSINGVLMLEIITTGYYI